MKIHRKYYMKFYVKNMIHSTFLNQQLAIHCVSAGRSWHQRPSRLPWASGVGTPGPKVSSQVRALGEGQVASRRPWEHSMHRKCSYHVDLFFLDTDEEPFIFIIM